MSLKTARDAVASGFKTAIETLHPSIYVAYQNEPKRTPPATTTYWLRFGVQPLRAEQPAIGSPRTLRDFAQAVVEIFTVPGTGQASLYTLEAEVRGIFAGAALSGAKFSDTRELAPRFLEIGLVDDLGTWWKGIVTAPFRYDYSL